ncbi:MAG: ATP-binding cassette domain-containing protein [Nitrospinota bacterium]|nr:ATP-binding cassette domain-containing protein [Nitrospinota bacterium]
MIEVDGLTKFYGNLPGIQDVSFKVEEGEILGFLGPNGAGKSTTMRILTGYMPPTSGTVRLDGIDVIEKPLEVQKRLGYLPENNPLYPEMTVSAYLGFVASVKGLRGAGKAAAIDRVVGGCGLEDVASRIIGHLSKGYRQRVGLAQALVNDPHILIMDEPTSGLDPAQIIEIRDLIRGLKGNHTIILSTHILPEVNVICDRVVVIHQGRIAAEGALDALAASVEDEETIRVSALGPAEAIRSGLASVSGVRDVSLKEDEAGEEVHLEISAEKGRDVRPDLVAAVSAAGGRLTGLYRERITLEDTFVKIIGGESRSGEEAAHV